MRDKIILISLIFIVAILFSWRLARLTIYTDFPVFYGTANAILSGESAYNVNFLRTFEMPEDVQNGVFVYSLPIAYLLAPIGLLSYHSAKALLILIAILSYLSAVAMMLKSHHAKGRQFAYPLAISCLWFPFLQDLRLAQVNSVIFLLITVSMILAQKEKACLSGLFLAFAALFKIFPLGIAVIVGLKNWRILASCVFFFLLSFLIPGSLEWITSIGNVHRAGVVPLFEVVGQYWFSAYAVLIGLGAVIVALRWRDKDYGLLYALAIPAVFLMMPFIEYYHLVLLMISYVYVWAEGRNWSGFIPLSIVSVLMIGLPYGFFLYEIPIPVFVGEVLPELGILALWVGIIISRNKRFIGFGADSIGSGNYR